MPVCRSASSPARSAAWRSPATRSAPIACCGRGCRPRSSSSSSTQPHAGTPATRSRRTPRPRPPPSSPEPRRDLRAHRHLGACRPPGATARRRCSAAWRRRKLPCIRCRSSACICTRSGRSTRSSTSSAPCSPSNGSAPIGSCARRSTSAAARWCRRTACCRCRPLRRSSFSGAHRSTADPSRRSWSRRPARSSRRRTPSRSARCRP